MVWLYILLDVFLIAAFAGVVLFLIYIIRKKETHEPMDLAQFRNGDIYEKSRRDRLEKAHIDEIEHSEINEPVTVEDIPYNSEYRKRDLDAILNDGGEEDDNGD